MPKEVGDGITTCVICGAAINEKRECSRLSEHPSFLELPSTVPQNEMVDAAWAWMTSGKTGKVGN